MCSVYSVYSVGVDGERATMGRGDGSDGGEWSQLVNGVNGEKGVNRLDGPNGLDWSMVDGWIGLELLE